MLIFSHITTFFALLILSNFVNPWWIAIAVFVIGFFMPVYIVAGLIGYFIDVVFLSGRELFFSYQHTVIFVILVFIAQYIKKRLVR